MTSYRQARPEDLYHMGLTNLDPLTENYDVNFYLNYMMTWPELFIVAREKGGDIVGYVMGKVEEDPLWARFSKHYLPWHGHVTALTVAPQYRGLGIARGLTKRLEAACDAKGALFMDLFVRKGNPAVAMYKKMGYSVFRVVEKYYSDDPTGRGDGEDAYDMRMSLSADKDNKHVRENGERFIIQPEDMYHG